MDHIPDVQNAITIANTGVVTFSDPPNWGDGVATGNITGEAATATASTNATNAQNVYVVNKITEKTYQIAFVEMGTGTNKPVFTIKHLYMIQPIIC